MTEILFAGQSIPHPRAQQPLRILLVIYCEPSREQIRIISARKATKGEQRQYLERLKK